MARHRFVTRLGPIDDNATAVAGALEVARVMAQAEFDRTITVACWDHEKRGCQFRGDFVALIADESARPFFEPMVVFADSVGLPMVVLALDASQQNVPDLRRSDHASVWDINVPAIMITDTANFRNPSYHCADGEDTADKLDSTFATQVVAATVASAAQAAGLR